MAVICLAGVGFAGGQTAPAAKQTVPAAKTAAPAQKQEMAGTYFKNVQVPVLKNLPIDEFMDTMGFFAASEPELHRLSHRGKRRQLGQVCRRHAAQNYHAQDAPDGQRHQCQ